jgi:phytoene synthase
VTEDEILASASSSGPAAGPLLALLAFQAERAEAHYRRAQELLPAEDRRRLIAAEIMGAIYHEILGELRRGRFPQGRVRVRLSKPRKAWIAARTFLKNRLS